MDDERCSVCLANLNDNDEHLEIMQLECGHKFHKTCILNWFRSQTSNGNCPLCNDNPHNPQDSSSYCYYTLNNRLLDQRFNLVKREILKQKNPNKTDIKNIERIKQDKLKAQELDKKYKLLQKDEYYMKIKKEMKDARCEMYKLHNKVKTNKIKILSKTPFIFGFN